MIDCLVEYQRARGDRAPVRPGRARDLIRSDVGERARDIQDSPEPRRDPGRRPSPRAAVVDVHRPWSSAAPRGRCSARAWCGTGRTDSGRRVLTARGGRPRTRALTGSRCPDDPRAHSRWLGWVGDLNGPLSQRWDAPSVIATLKQPSRLVDPGESGGRCTGIASDCMAVSRTGLQRAPSSGFSVAARASHRRLPAAGKVRFVRHRRVSR